MSSRGLPVDAARGQTGNVALRRVELRPSPTKRSVLRPEESSLELAIRNAARRTGRKSGTMRTRAVCGRDATRSTKPSGPGQRSHAVGNVAVPRRDARSCHGTTTEVPALAMASAGRRTDPVARRWPACPSAGRTLMPRSSRACAIVVQLASIHSRTSKVSPTMACSGTSSRIEICLGRTQSTASTIQATTSVPIAATQAGQSVADTSEGASASGESATSSHRDRRVGYTELSAERLLLDQLIEDRRGRQLLQLGRRR